MPSTGNILDVAPQGENDSRSECYALKALNTENGVSGRTYCAPKCEGREGYYRVSESLVMDVSGLKLQHPQHTAVSVRHTVSARPDGRGTELRLTADGSTGGNEPSPADSQISTPLYLLASEIVDVVTKGYEQ